jgi:hypothetical protein
MHDTRRPSRSALTRRKAVRRDSYRFSRNAILTTIALVWLIGLGWTAYFHESRINRDWHRQAVTHGCSGHNGS